jgi:ComF family protein
MYGTELLKSFSRYILDLVFPVLCLECHSEGSYLCPKCAFRLTMLTKTQVCPVCAKPSPLGQTHAVCHNRGLDGFTHALRYKDPVVKRLVESMKYQGVSDIGPLGGQILFQEILNQNMEKYFADFVLVPLPLHPKRLRWRGYNQTELIGRETARLLQIPCRSDLLIKIKHSKAQATLNKTQRQQNLSGAFIAANVAGLKILLVDDVATTRSTLTEAASALKKAQAQTVWALTLAYEN